MGYYRKVWTEEKIERLWKEGRGRGTGADYRPLLEVHDVPSLGLARRAQGNKTGRVHHLLSTIEYHFFLMLDWARGTGDIREGYPIDRELTQDMALTLRIKHPCYPGTRVPTIMTVDFLVTDVPNGEAKFTGFDVKRSEAAEEERTIDKLELMRASLAEIGVPHHLVYHSKLPTTKIKNLEWIRLGLLKENEVKPHSDFFEGHCTRMAGALERASQNLRLNDFCLDYDARCGMPQGTGLRIAQMLMHNRILIPTLSDPDLASAPLNHFRICAPLGQLRLMEAA